MRYALGALAIASVLSTAAPLCAEPWKISMDANLTLTQNAYSDNWIGGESGSLSWTLNSNSLAERQLTPKVNTKNSLKLSFGQTHNQDRQTKDWLSPVKSTDRIDFETVWRFTLGGWVDPYASARIESQFLDQSDVEKTRYVNPLLLTESFGVARVFIKEEKREWTARLGAGFRQHLDRDALDPATDTRSDRSSSDGGILFVSDFKTPLADTAITYTAKLSVFQALFYSRADEFEGTEAADYWKAPDVNWENMFSASITKYLMVNLYVQLLYDKEVSLAGRFKQTLSLGFTYTIH